MQTKMIRIEGRFGSERGDVPGWIVDADSPLIQLAALRAPSVKLCLETIPLGASPVNHLTFRLISSMTIPSLRILSKAGENERLAVISARCLTRWSGTGSHPATRG